MVSWMQKVIEQHELLINRLNSEMVKRGDMLNINDIIDTLSVKLIG